jgi:hypothetical protein
MGYGSDKRSRKYPRLLWVKLLMPAVPITRYVRSDPIARRVHSLRRVWTRPMQARDETA